LKPRKTWGDQKKSGLFVLKLVGNQPGSLGINIIECTGRN